MSCDPVLSRILYGFREGLDWWYKIGFGHADCHRLSCFDTGSHVVWDMDGTFVRVHTLDDVGDFDACRVFSLKGRETSVSAITAFLAIFQYDMICMNLTKMMIAAKIEYKWEALHTIKTRLRWLGFRQFACESCPCSSGASRNRNPLPRWLVLPRYGYNSVPTCFPRVLVWIWYSSCGNSVECRVAAARVGLCGLSSEHTIEFANTWLSLARLHSFFPLY